MATSGKSINLWWGKGTKLSSYLTGLLGFSSENEESGKSEKPQTKLMVGPIAVVSSVFSQFAATFIPRIVQLFMMVLHPFLCSLFFFPNMFAVQVCRQLGHRADRRWDSNGHHQWGDDSHQFHRVRTADRRFYTELQDVLRQH